MTIQDIIDLVTSMGGVLVLRPQEGEGSPEIAWGDVFFYFAPDGVVPHSQPFATIVTKGYPGDEDSRLDRQDAFRVNVAAGTAEFRTWTGLEPRERAAPSIDASVANVVLPHPVYGSLGWLAIVNPGTKTTLAMTELLRTAHRLARDRFHRRAHGSGPATG